MNSIGPVSDLHGYKRAGITCPRVVIWTPSTARWILFLFIIDIFWVFFFWKIDFFWMSSNHWSLNAIESFICNPRQVGQFLMDVLFRPWLFFHPNRRHVIRQHPMVFTHSGSTVPSLSVLSCTSFTNTVWSASWRFPPWWPRRRTHIQRLKKGEPDLLYPSLVNWSINTVIQLLNKNVLPRIL